MLACPQAMAALADNVSTRALLVRERLTAPGGPIHHFHEADDS